MSYDRIVISSGHGLYVRGACGIIDEVDEARTLVDVLADELKLRGVDVVTYHDDISKTQNENLNRIVDYHNSQTRDLDISCHFNAYEQVSKPMGTAVLFVTQGTLAGQLSAAISEAGGFINRGAKKRTDLFFLNSTEAAAVLLEICFVDSQADCLLYRDHFGDVVAAIADTLSGISGMELPDVPPPVNEISVTGTCSWFGGPDDLGVSPSEGLAFIYEIDDDNQFLFLPFQPKGTTGLARRLNPYVHYCAMRWDYDEHPKDTLLEKVALVRNIKTGAALT